MKYHIVCDIMNLVLFKGIEILNGKKRSEGHSQRH